MIIFAKGPIVLSMSRRLFVSFWLMVLVSIATIKNTETKKIVPIIRRIQLAKVRLVMRTYVRVAVIEDERIIFADEDQSTLTL